MQYSVTLNAVWGDTKTVVVCDIDRWIQSNGRNGKGGAEKLGSLRVGPRSAGTVRGPRVSGRRSTSDAGTADWQELLEEHRHVRLRANGSRKRWFALVGLYNELILDLILGLCYEKKSKTHDYSILKCDENIVTFFKTLCVLSKIKMLVF